MPAKESSQGNFERGLKRCPITRLILPAPPVGRRAIAITEDHRMTRLSISSDSVSYSGSKRPEVTALLVYNNPH